MCHFMRMMKKKINHLGRQAGSATLSRGVRSRGFVSNKLLNGPRFFKNASGHSGSRVYRIVYATKIISGNGPPHGRSKLSELSCRRSGLSCGGGQPRSQGGIEPLDISGVEGTEVGLGDSDPHFGGLVCPVGQPSFDRHDSSVDPSFDHLNHV